MDKVRKEHSKKLAKKDKEIEKLTKKNGDMIEKMKSEQTRQLDELHQMYAQKISVLQEQADGQLAKFEQDLVKMLRSDSKKFLRSIFGEITTFE